MDMSNRGWIGFDLDGTLAKYDTWQGITHIGKPIPAMIKKVKEHLKEGYEVKIFTARVTPYRIDDMQTCEASLAIKAWCKKHIGVELDVTCIKDFQCLCIYDDRCIRVEFNTGRILSNE